MRCSTIFTDLVSRNAKVKLANDADLKKTINDFWFTLDSINGRERDTLVLSNGYRVEDYEILKNFESMVFPGAVTVNPGAKYTDYLDRSYKFCEEQADAKMLSPNAFKEAIIYILSVMRVTVNENDFVALKADERTISTSEAEFYMYKESTTVGVLSQFPIPVILDFVTRRYLMMPVDDEFIKEWMKANVFNKFLVKSNS